MVRVMVLGVLVAWASLIGSTAGAGAESPGHIVRGARRCGRFFRDTLFVVPADREFTLTGLGVEFRPKRGRLPDSLAVGVYLTNAGLYRQQGIVFRRGTRCGPTTKVMERFVGLTYPPGDTIVVTVLGPLDEEYKQVDGWPEHVVRWEGYTRRVGGTAKAARPWPKP